MKLIRIGKDQYKTTKWSGGNTTELFIYPADSSYQAQDFSIRISTASIESSPSVFTQLPRTQRKLMVLQGALFITHPGRYHTLLLPYDTDAFEGNWNTESKGTGEDYNVMTRGNLSSNLGAVELAAGHQHSVCIQAHSLLTHFFVYKGHVLFSTGDAQIEIGEGTSFAVADEESTIELLMQAVDQSVIICTSVI